TNPPPVDRLLLNDGSLAINLL
ncbi:hypothetical protein A2U01_0117098, partial [Trifolium medium]|nr:hypothetical protein [Trifolium medium]